MWIVATASTPEGKVRSKAAPAHPTRGALLPPRTRFESVGHTVAVGKRGTCQGVAPVAGSLPRPCSSLAALGLAIAIMGAACSDGSGAPGATSTSTTAGSSNADALTDADQTRIETGVTSQDPAARSKVLSDVLAGKPEIANQPFLRAGSVLSLQRSTFRTLRGGSASVEGAVSGPEPGRWLILLARESGEWRVAGARRL